MRDIKFRIWDSDINMYIYSDDFTEFYEFFEIAAYDKEEKCEQFIGVKDNNGIDIYEGDFLVGHSLPGAAERELLYYTVVWDNTISGGVPLTGFKLMGHETNINRLRSPQKGLVVVGNIHEGENKPNEI